MKTIKVYALSYQPKQIKNKKERARILNLLSGLSDTKESKISKDSELVFYIGQTDRAPETRLKEHLSASKNSHSVDYDLPSKIFIRAVEKAGGTIYQTVLDESCDKDFVSESEWVSRLESVNHALTNKATASSSRYTKQQIEQKIADNERRYQDNLKTIRNRPENIARRERFKNLVNKTQ